MRTLHPQKNTLTDKLEIQKQKLMQQAHLLGHWKALSSEQQLKLQQQILNLDTSFIEKQQKFLSHPHNAHSVQASPFKKIYPATSAEALFGTSLIAQGKAALVVLAGGQGSRLQCAGPKGCVPVTCIRKKTLFQLLAEKIQAATKLAGCDLEVVIMTSPNNHEETSLYFQQHDFFGLKQHLVHFLPQEMVPLINFEGKLFLEEADQIAYGPNGNGGIFKLLHQTGLLKHWDQQGIECVQMLPIDNPLALPFDSSLIGFHFSNNNEISLKTALKKTPQENVGVLAEINEKALVLEYSELKEEDRLATDALGNLKFAHANLGIYCFSLNFLHKAAFVSMPLHAAKKAVKMLGYTQNHLPNAWKFEEFIFDIFPLAERIAAQACIREQCFAPLKNLHGDDSMETVKVALQRYDRHIFAHISGTNVPQERHFELAPQFYYPTQELVEKWKGKPLPPEEYIDE